MLCYEHHVEMKIGRAQLELRDESAETTLYACQEHGCLVHYANSRGYFILAQDTTATEREMEPCVRCPKDGQLMYLAKVAREKKFPLVEMSGMCRESYQSGDSCG